LTTRRQTRAIYPWLYGLERLLMVSRGLHLWRGYLNGL
jgi:hypothetical protein